MIGYLKGTVSHLFTDTCFLDVHGVGYRVFIPFSTRDKLAAGKEALLYTYLNVKEDALTLFGFYTTKEYDMFLHLIGVTGIGPKLAMNILAKVAPDEFYFSVSHRKIEALTKIPGVGKKTAERIILELKDKVKSEENDFLDTDNVFAKPGAQFSDAEQDAVAALAALGYSQNEASASVRKINGKKTAQEYSAQELIKLALKELTTR